METLRNKIENTLWAWKYGNEAVSNYLAIVITATIIALVKKEIEECLQ